MEKKHSGVLSVAAFLFTVEMMVFLAACGPSPAGRGAASNAKSGAVKHSFLIQQTDLPMRVDGRLDEKFWKSADRLAGFRVGSDPDRIPPVKTEVLLAYSGESLYAAFVLEEAANSGQAPASDICEISIFSRPETPFYSPYLQRLDYMNANEAVRTMRRFEVTASNEKRQSNVSKVGPHTSYIIDYEWKSCWQTAAAAKKGSVVIEASIPWADIGGLPKPGHTFRANFVRTRKTPEGENEGDWFNWYSGPNIPVKPWASQNFIQEYPTIFATALFEDGRAVLTRFVETEDPWSVLRALTEYEKVLSGRPDPGRSAHFYLGLTSFLLPDSIRKLYDEKAWEAEESNMLAEFGEAGINGPFLPGFLGRAGLGQVEALYKKYGMRFSYHGYANAKQAAQEGATTLTPGGGAAFFDPAYIRLKNKMLEDFLGKHGKAPWLADVWGQDEPFNQISTILQPGTYERVDAELKKYYGVGLGVPQGTPNAPYQDQPVHANSRVLPDRSTALSRIAMFRWMNKTYSAVARGEYGIVRRLAPGKPYQAFNRNAVADLDFLDQAMLWDYTDYYSADPYPSFCIYVYGPARSRYHVGFTSKLVTDLAAGKPSQMIVQGCYMIQRLSTVENVREWALQAAKAGVSKLDWWGTPRLDRPELYSEMVRLSKLWKSTPALDLPKKSDIALLFSDDARAGAGDEGLQAHYSLHSIIGERLGAWYDFVSENHVRRGLHSLEGKKILIAPELGYISRPFAEDILRRVKDGGMLVVMDPDAFAYDIETGSLEDIRQEILGMRMAGKRAASELRPTAAGSARFHVEKPLPLRSIPIVGDTMNARTLEPPSGADILLSYEDGTPAAYSRKLGQGEVILFGAMPFWDSELAVEPAGWDTLLGALIDECGIARNLPIWKFQFPASGGEPTLLDLLVSFPRN
ncbi:MAG: hypothetical protein A2W03_11070 [Candidatus Aminicenantes bacterium RBG_16_63_16]|nr:MAG: hypothetical protein A2W03_11070 [Candidatus Aminicenantes bacterium RBG_16_63_16]